ncbi:hypothetical protein BZG35_08595 [Brevundimonas sp. LM2]|uniref:PP2C family protein-serine/threonine phosphatase n=1 Tax=Brevundimonas sp. LM2 TaxID=1938605 RepID=UPI000983940B|nr:protein phosphatase 2C domain-containing protein [Brevundimonas sp. LM2]AQR61704.1 hypothetical protein BZG35_08595 [Brevundimonas sp. LM2]
MIVSASPLPLRTASRRARYALDIHADQVQGMRPRQEDGALVRRVRDAVLVAVADGVGGHPAGEEAAALALDTLDQNFLVQNFATPLEAGDWLAAVFKTAHAAVTAFGKGWSADGKRPCTTLTAAVILPRSGVFAYASAGDSHLYRCDGKAGIARLTTVQQDEKGRLTSCIGGKRLVIDGAGQLYLMRPGETLLFATDGLDVLSLPLVAATVGDAPTASAAAAKLLDLVDRRAHPKQDNASLAVVRVRPAQPDAVAARDAGLAGRAGAAR